ncbi:phage gp6-like head-tail connector protein [Clostridium phage CWou-2020a]|uniref:Phage protein (Possible DNA packaging) n=1 Tax=Clostridium botulinum C/D str. DC5 TaxID=1443128 RepID=A0A0A0IMT8_CLOBO|nr:phage protein (possible DNA packaging) [Clostridium botulinum C/D str. DC5]KOC54202.1 DNA packaging protein [Clostridium botulinum]MCD3240916.1 phage gp6-like head-tail connector protein [Clostridium botulinum D/C]QPW59464.1 phage gp6-like head-tail connector protein [Clostridium phage CWou-2020a]KOC56546.1 DNA packaging protein [Clostridium botulinum]
MKLNEIKEYLKIDEDYEDSLLNELIEASEVYIESMVGESYKANKKLIKLADLLQKRIIADMYENRSTTVGQDVKQDRITTSILEKLSNCTEDIKNERF